jgi:hypothetical protein
LDLFMVSTITREEGIFTELYDDAAQEGRRDVVASIRIKPSSDLHGGVDIPDKAAEGDNRWRGAIS